MLHEIFQANELIIQFASGQAFFVLGLSVALRARWRSRLELARALPALALFGLLHGFATWGRGFIPVQASYLGPVALDGLHLFQAILMAASLAALLHFGLQVSPWRYQRATRGLVEALAVMTVGLSWWWSAANGAGSADQAHVAESLARYLLGFPGALLAGLGLEREARAVAARGLARPAAGLRWAAVACLAFAVLGGLVAPCVPLVSGSLPGAESLFAAVDLPIAVVRAVCGLAIAAAVWRALEVFDAELNDLLAAARDSEVRAAERLRVGQELHDSVFQAIYGAGLMLEDTLQDPTALPDSAREKLRSAMGVLDRTVTATRTYILELGAEADSIDAGAPNGKANHVATRPDR